MRLSHKLGKLFTGKALESASRHTAAVIRNRRLPTQLSAEEVISTIDPHRFQVIRRKYADANAPASGAPKYFNLQAWIPANLQRVRELQLEYMAPQSILDLGCGAGYFLYICKLLGHRVLGLDIHRAGMFGDMAELLGIPRVITRIEAFNPLPHFNQTFDLITAFLVCFNGHKNDRLWGTSEWDFFLNDVASRLTPKGRVCLTLNREYDGTYYTPELERLFLSRGAEIESYRVVFSPGKLAPVEAVPVS